MIKLIVTLQASMFVPWSGNFMWYFVSHHYQQRHFVGAHSQPPMPLPTRIRMAPLGKPVQPFCSVFKKREASGFRPQQKAPRCIWPNEVIYEDFCLVILMVWEMWIIMDSPKMFRHVFRECQRFASPFPFPVFFLLIREFPFDFSRPLTARSWVARTRKDVARGGKILVTVYMFTAS